MTPRHLLTLCLAVVIVSHAESSLSFENDAISNSDYKRSNPWMTVKDELKKHGSTVSCPALAYHPGICLEETSKTTKCLSDENCDSVHNLTGHLPNQTAAPDFWWDLTLDHNASISTVLVHQPTMKDRTDPKTGFTLEWDLGWAEGLTCTWSAGGSANWVAWTWEAKNDSEISGGGFVFSRTGEEWIFAGVSWLRDGHTDIITWNCFVDGNSTEPIPWSNWDMYLDNNTKPIGFVNNETEWGFYVDSDLILSEHCAHGIPVAGKRFKFLHGKEIEQSVQDDPFKAANSSRPKRSPDFFENVRQRVKDLFERAKKLLGIGQQTDGEDGQQGREGGQNCNSFLDLLVRIINLIFGRRGTSGCPGGSPPGGTPPSAGGTPPSTGGAPPEYDIGGDPPGGANVPPADAEELDPTQNDAVRDWE